jgi:hypothetical protein
MATKVIGAYSGEGNRLRFRDTANMNETVLPVAEVYFIDDFLGKAIDTTINWTALDTSAAGNTTPALTGDASSGVIGTMLDATNEVQLSGITGGDQRNYILNQGLNAEFRMRFTTIPTGAVIACLGLCGDHNAAADSVAESIWFRADGSGAMTVETDDTVNETSKVATGVTFLVNEWHVLRISCDDITSVKFYIDGSQVASGTTFNMSQVAGLKLQPVVRIGKESGATTVGTIETDYIRVWQNRS